MIYNDDLVLPEWSLLGLDSLVEQLTMLSEITNELMKKGKDVGVESRKIHTLRIELKLIKEILEIKYKEFQIVDLEVLFKHVPKLVRQSDQDLYEELTQIKAKVSKVIDVDKEEKLKEKTIAYKQNYTMSWDLEFSEPLFDFLLENMFIDSESDKQSLSNLFKLESITSDKRIIWIDKILGKPSIKVLTMMFDTLVNRKAPRKHGAIPLDLFITEYFKLPTGEFNKASLRTNTSNLVKELEAVNDREKKLINFFQKNYSIFSRRVS